jgi:D-lyxose ketol-isomerase
LNAPAWAACDEDTIETVSEDGDLIILTSGQDYDVTPGDDATASLWLEGQSVLVCGDTIINKDDDDEQVEVTPH